MIEGGDEDKWHMARDVYSVLEEGRWHNDMSSKGGHNFSSASHLPIANVIMNYLSG